MDRKVYIDKLAAQLKEWDAEMVKLEAKAEKAGAAAEAELREQMQDLKDKEKSARERLAEVVDAQDEAWDELKSGTEEAFSTLKGAFRAAMEKFK